MNLRALAPITALAWLALAGVAHAQTMQSPIDVSIWLPDGNNDFRESNDIERIDYFNYAHCLCGAEDKPPGIFQVELELTAQGTSYDFASPDANLVVGTNCDNDDIDVRSCVPVATIPDVVDDLRNAHNFNVGADDSMFPDGSGCQQQDGSSTVYVTFDPENDNIIDESVTAKYNFDAEPPPLPKNVRATPGEDAINISWDALESQQSEVEAFQVLCAKADGSAVFATPEQPLYDTPAGLCGSTAPVSFFPGEGATPTGPDAGPGQAPDAGASPDAGEVFAAALPDWMANLDERYVCGTAGQTSLSIRIDGLENGQAYRVALLVVDDARNVVAVDLGEVTPKEVTDFWEDYHDQGGAADGGICLVTSTFGDDSGMTQALRDFRDRTLAASAAGRMLIAAYYEYAAPLGVHAAHSLALRVAAAVMLAPLAGLAAFWEYTSLPIKLLVLLALLLMRRRRRRHARPELDIERARAGVPTSRSRSRKSGRAARTSPSCSSGSTAWATTPISRATRKRGASRRRSSRTGPPEPSRPRASRPDGAAAGRPVEVTRLREGGRDRAAARDRG